MLGDSLTIGNGGSGIGYGPQLAGLVPFGELIQDQAVAGQQTSYVYGVEWLTAKRQRTWGKVPVLAGVNDLIADVAVATIEANLSTTWTSIAATGAVPVLITISPWKNSASWSSGRQTNTDTVNSYILAQATANGWPSVDSRPLLWLAGDHSLLDPANDSGDHIHYSSAGASALAASVKTAAGL